MEEDPKRHRPEEIERGRKLIPFWQTQKAERIDTSQITPFQKCPQCDSEEFKIWGKWGIWYAMCVQCEAEFGLFPKNFFRLLRDPRDEEYGKNGNTVA